LAGRLGDELELVVVGRDAVKTGIAVTEATNEGAVPPDSLEIWQEGEQAFYPIVASFLDHGVSVIAESSWGVGISEESIRDWLLARADVVFILCQAAAASERALERISLRAARTNALTEEELSRYRAIVHGSAKRASVTPRIPIPTLRVDTTQGYDPPLSTIVQFVLTRGQRLHPDPN
jgi:hypothetical protein